MDAMYTNLKKLLEEKLEFFMEYGRVTDEILRTDDENTLQTLMDTRDMLEKSISCIDASIAELRKDENFPVYVLNYTEYQCGAKTPKDEPLIELSGKIFDVIRDIRLKNSDILQRFEKIKLENLQKIKKNFHAPNISSYFQNIKMSSSPSSIGRG